MITLKAGKYFVAATGTAVGKTFMLTKICAELLQKKINCNAIKPIESGFADVLKSDAAKILRSLNQEITQKNIANITPWRFLAPLAPSLAANIENRKIDFFELENFCRNKILQAKNDEFFFIEAAGGVMTPINDDKTFLDLIAALKIPVLLVTNNYLGSISHTLCAVEALKSREVAIAKIIVNDWQNQDEAVKIADMIDEIARLSAVETVDFGII